jgi:hypothetical protein
MIDIIEKSVLQGEQWSTEIATRRATQNFLFDEYCTALTTCIRTTVEKSGVSNAHGYFGKSSEATAAVAPPMLIRYGEQYSNRRTSRPQVPRKGNCRSCGKPGHWMLECPSRRKSGSSHLDALHARVKDAGGGTAGIAKILYEVGEELNDAEQDDEAEEDAQQELTNAYEEFIMTERDADPSDFQPARA